MRLKESRLKEMRLKEMRLKEMPSERNAHVLLARPMQAQAPTAVYRAA
jgi:hypothetical protein